MQALFNVFGLGDAHVVSGTNQNEEEEASLSPQNKSYTLQTP
jgi:hypothetical protein